MCFWLSRRGPTDRHHEGVGLAARWVCVGQVVHSTDEVIRLRRVIVQEGRQRRDSADVSLQRLDLLTLPVLQARTSILNLLVFGDSRTLC
jgi:hypothetical protein